MLRPPKQKYLQFPKLNTSNLIVYRSHIHKMQKTKQNQTSYSDHLCKDDRNVQSFSERNFNDSIEGKKVNERENGEQNEIFYKRNTSYLCKREIRKRILNYKYQSNFKEKILTPANHNEQSVFPSASQDIAKKCFSKDKTNGFQSYFTARRKKYQKDYNVQVGIQGWEIQNDRFAEKCSENLFEKYGQNN